LTCLGAVVEAGSECQDVAMAHDAGNRMVKKTYTDGTPAVTFTYDACPNGIGRLCKVSAAVSPTETYENAYEFDVAGRVVKSTQKTNGDYVFTYGYNVAGGLQSTVMPGGRTLTQCYDRAGRAKSVTGSKAGEASVAYASQAS
jgi:YD repeat-containing protein